MPTYEYRCLKCGAEFEHFQKMTDEPLETCPECKGDVRRLISRGGGVLFKGTGFYATDYRSDNGGSSGSSKPDTSDGASDSDS
jgi:putative FmdB family regulatory protein